MLRAMQAIANETGQTGKAFFVDTLQYHHLYFPTFRQAQCITLLHRFPQSPLKMLYTPYLFYQLSCNFNKENLCTF